MKKVLLPLIIRENASSPPPSFLRILIFGSEPDKVSVASLVVWLNSIIFESELALWIVSVPAEVLVIVDCIIEVGENSCIWTLPSSLNVYFFLTTPA